MNIINELPTREVCEIVRRLRPRLYIDFFQYLPPEVCLKILGFLDPVSLINTARASREWMLLALDRKLWEHLYILEGFRVIRSEVLKFEASLNGVRSIFSGQADEGHASKRRATPQRILPSLSGDGDSEMIDAAMVKQDSLFGPSSSRQASKSRVDLDEPMTDLSPVRAPRIAQYPTRPLSNRAPLQDRTKELTPPKTASSVSNISSLAVLDRSDNKKKLNWQYLYSQRRRLEANWEAEKYTNFQLPHPNHPEEAHSECIYTIQHSGKYLVSGSRDKTLRIWDLDTRRLVREPLSAHTGSVLCLQFDADPDEDLIVSGSSDATIVLWKFSTGQVLQRLRRAHKESVLNVRFDKRVLVTCSKDKTIKIFNRKPLSPGDVGYPDRFQGVNPVPTYLNNYGFNPAPTAGLSIIPAYSIIGCLDGHHAAVNAVQIHGDEIVSASGDRTVKVWNWPEQTCLRTFIGHTKGIACVQYDGRRIVSGSSDNEVKVFDKESGLEVASLRAHTSLVRTVQAGFGDLPYSEEEDKEDAKNTDNEYFKAVDSGSISRTVLLQRGRPRNAGSRKPEDITAYGAKLPPGGGGGRFGRIVSGSYDETIIIWRRDREGIWRAQHTLRQEEAAHVASRFAAERPSIPNSLSLPSQQASTSQPSSASTSHEPPSTSASSDVNAPLAPFAPGTASFYYHLIDLTVGQGTSALRHALQAHPQMLTYSYLQETINNLPEGPRQSMTNVVAAATLLQSQLPGGHSGTDSQYHTLVPSSVPNPQASIQAQASTSASASASSSTSTQAAVQAPVAPTNVTQGPLVTTPGQISTPHTHPVGTIIAPGGAVLVPPGQPHAAPQHNHHLPANMARVFKLQFDARRIICCSQTSVIVGWDFANGDEQIMEASRFFAPVE